MFEDIKIYIGDKLLPRNIYNIELNKYFNGLFPVPSIAECEITSNIKNILLKFKTEYKIIDDTVYLYPFDENILSLF